MEKEQSFGQKYVLALKKGYSILLIFAVIGVLLGLLISTLSYKKKYAEINYVQLDFTYTNSISFDYHDILSEKNIHRCKQVTRSLETGNSVSTYKYVELSDYSIEKNGDNYRITCNMDSFNVSKDGGYSDAAAKGFLKHLTILPMLSEEEFTTYMSGDQKGISQFDMFDKSYYQKNSLDENGKIHVIYSNPDAVLLNQKHQVSYYSTWIASLGVGFLIGGFIFILVFTNKLENETERIYDNETIYRTPFHKSLFVKSAKHLKEVKSLCLMSILLAFVLITKLLPIPSGFGNLGISFGFIFLSVAAMLYGPCPALVMGALSDILGYLIRPDGMFFIGYTIQAMLASFCYAMCFYRTHITYSRCLLARVFVNLFANVIVGGISWGIISGFTVDATITYMLTISLPKNLVYLLPQSLVIYFVLRALARPISAMGVLPQEIAENISFF